MCMCFPNTDQMCPCYLDIARCCVPKPIYYIRIFLTFTAITRSRDSVFGIAAGYELEDGGVRVPVGSRIFSSPRRPDRLWGPLNLLYNGYRELFPRG
jgi:hypothetical protein